MPLAISIVSPFLSINDSILVPRIITVLFTLASSIIIFEIVKNYYDKRAAFISAILFIFSFQTIRFGTRFYLDAYGVFFFLLSIYLTKKNRLSFAGLSFALAMLSREIWLGMYPFMIIYLFKERKSIARFLLWSAIPMLIFVVFIHMTIGLDAYMNRSGFAQEASYVSSNLYQTPISLTQSWIEFLVIQAVTTLGFLAWVWKKRDNLLILIIPQFLLMSLTQGFISNGAMTQYAMWLQATMALLAGPGLLILEKKYFGKYNFKTLILLILILQFFLFSYLASVLSLRGAIGVHDFGYWYDEQVMTLLNQKAKNESIAGLHGAFIKDAGKWIWRERNVRNILELEPDWYVIVEPQLIKFKTEPKNVKEVELYNIGPYIVLHSHPNGHLGDLIEPNEKFSKWALRE